MQMRPPAETGGRNFKETERLPRRYLTGQFKLVGVFFAGYAIAASYPRQSKREQKVQ
ncbi:MAG TPA: hypothetical protein VIA07_09720 [Desulfuromonadales bacterium]